MDELKLVACDPCSQQSRTLRNDLEPSVFRKPACRAVVSAGVGRGKACPCPHGARRASERRRYGSYAAGGWLRKRAAISRCPLVFSSLYCPISQSETGSVIALPTRALWQILGESLFISRCPYRSVPATRPTMDQHNRYLRASSSLPALSGSIHQLSRIRTELPTRYSYFATASCLGLANLSQRTNRSLSGMFNGM